MDNMNIKPILFNTEMVKAIIDGRKTVTRRVVKPQPGKHSALLRWDYGMPVFEDGTSAVQPYRPGDILWVRETWAYNRDNWFYKADYPADEDFSWAKWHPSIHMPKEAARIFLRVTGVRVERLQDIDADGIRAEGLTSACAFLGDMEIAAQEFALLWDSTIKPADREKYGWAASPWVWAIEFERCERPEEWPV